MSPQDKLEVGIPSETCHLVTHAWDAQDEVESLIAFSQLWGPTAVVLTVSALWLTR